MNGIFGNKAVFVLLVAFLLAVSLGGAFVLCTMDMSPLQHLSEWQSNFAAVAQQAAAITLLLFFVLAVFRHFLQTPLLQKQTGVLVSRYPDTGRVFDPLRLAFARGVLNSKAY